MRITNKYNLPETIVNALERPTYSKGGANLSITEMIGSPRISRLRAKHMDEIEVDASDLVWSLFGTAVHGVLEHGKGDDHIVEERLHTTVDGWTISGAIDLQTAENGSIVISDYKTCGVWAVMHAKQEWEAQLNCYAFMVEHVKKTPVSRLEIVAIIRDWNRRESTYKDNYPDAPIKTIPILLWTYADRERFVRDRIHAHADAMFSEQTGGDLPLCTAEECWEKPTYYAVKKIGGSRAKSVFNNREEADRLLEEVGKGYEVEVRDGERTRCKSYCQVSQFCSQYQSYLEGK